MAALTLVVFATTPVARAADSILGRPGKGQAWGYLGDGSAVMDAKPPVTFSMEKNTAWKLRLPSYGHGTPVVVADRAFVVGEPEKNRPWPLLIALSLADGKQLWSYELNHLPGTTLTPAQRTEAGKIWAEFWRKFMTFRELRHQLATKPETKADVEAKLKELATVKWDPANSKGYAKFTIDEGNQLNDKRSPYKSATLTLDTWSGMGGYGGYVIGEAFPTPTTDGKHLYAVTAQGGFFCFDFDGKLQWVKHYPGVAGEYCRNGRSPIIWQDLLLCDTTAMMRGIERATGELKWSAPVHGEAVLTPTVIRCGSTDIVLCGRGEAFRLPDGAALKVEGYTDFGTQALTKSDELDVVFFTGGGEHGAWTQKGDVRSCSNPPPTAVRFALEGTTLKATVLWDGKTVNGKGAPCHQRMVYCAGKLYHPVLGILEAATGKLLKAKAKNSPDVVPLTGHMLYLANGHLYGCVTDAKTGKMVVLVNTSEGVPVTRMEFPGYNYSSAFTVSGNSLLVRASDALWCFR